MRDTRRGIMLITTLLITTLILVFFVSITSMTFQSQREIRMAAENEKAVLAARTAYQEGLFYLSRDISKRLNLNMQKMKKGEDIDKNPITGFQNWKSVSTANSEDSLRAALPDDIFPPEYMMGYAYRAEYPFTSGSVVAGGRLTTDRGTVVKYVIASQIMEYEGIIAKNIRFDEIPDFTSDFVPDEKEEYSSKSNASLKSVISSVYSLDSGFRLKPWVGVGVPYEERNSAADYIKKHIPQGYIDVDFRNPERFVCDPFTSAKNEAGESPSYHLYDLNTAIKFAEHLELDNAAGPSKPSNNRGPWKKYTSYKLLYSQSGAEKKSYKGDDAADFSPFLDSKPYAKHFKGFKSIEVLHAGSLRNENIITGNNFWLIPWKNRKPEGENKKLQYYCLNYGTPDQPDLVLNNSLLIVTGNLRVAGNIRGSGVLAVYGDLNFYPNSVVKSPNNLVIYASGRIKCESAGAEEANRIKLIQSMPSYLPTRLLAYINKTPNEYDGYSDGLEAFKNAKRNIPADGKWTYSNFINVFLAYRQSYRKPGGHVWNENYWNKELFYWYEALRGNREIPVHHP